MEARVVIPAIGSGPLCRTRLGNLQRSSLESLHKRTGRLLGPLQVCHDLVGAVNERPHRDPPFVSALDARLRGQPDAVAGRDPRGQQAK